MSHFFSFADEAFRPNQMAGNLLWLESSDTSAANIAVSGSNVTQWTDKSGNAINGTQGTDADRPSTGGTTQNSKNTLAFDGTEDLSLPSGIFGISGSACTIFAVAKRTSEDGSPDTIFAVKASGGSKVSLFYGDVSGQVIFRSNNAAANAVNSSNTNTDFQILTARRSGTTQGISVNGDAEQTTADAADVTCDSADIGEGSSGGFHLTGELAEIIVFNRSLSTSERLINEVYLADKWGIYHPSANWINAYPKITRTAIHAGKHNKSVVDAQQPNLYILMGHSNIVGYNHPTISTAPAELQGTIPNVRIWDYTGGETGDWEVIEAGVNNKADTSLLLGPEMKFAEQLEDLNSEIQYIIKTAAVGGHMSDDSEASVGFHPTFGDQYGFLRARIKGAVETLAATGVIPKLAGYSIGLGGNDRTLARYLDVEVNFNRIVDALLAADSALGLTNTHDISTPIYCTSLVDYASPNGREATVEAGIDATVAAYSNMTKLSLSGFTVGADGVHLTSTGQVSQGSAFAAVYL